MGAVTEYLKNLIAQQVEANRLVVWFDPERHYGRVAEALDIPDTTVACYDGSFFALRRRIDTLLAGHEPPRLVVYLPMLEEESQDALVELTVIGAVMKPGQHPWQRNTRLSVVARSALRPILGEEAVASVEKQIDAGQLSLRDLDRLAEDKGGKGVISILFGTGDPKQIATAFLIADSGSKLFKGIVKRNALEELESLLGEAFEVDLPVGQGVESCRAALARHILTSAFIEDLAGDVPGPLATVTVAKSEGARRACQSVARGLRSRSDTRAAYVQWSHNVGSGLGLSAIPFTLEQLLSTEAFLSTEDAVQAMVEQSLLSGATQELVDLARTRQSGFWAEEVPETQARWALIAVAGQLLVEAERVGKEIGPHATGAAELVHSYASGERPWCLMDTYHRRMERHCQNLNFLGEAHLETLEKLVVRARQRYSKVADALALRFTAALQDGGFRVPGVRRQVEVYYSEVGPLVQETKVAYVLVDALRYEMGRELASALAEDFDVDLKCAVAAAPTITEVGMAALMPKADQGATLIPGDKGKIALKIGETMLKDRASRVKYLAEAAGVQAFATKLDDLLVGPSKRIREAIEAAQLVLVTSQEIDGICESDNILLARRMMDDIIYLLQKACRSLAGLGVGAIVLASDHGHIFGEEVASDMKIDSPGGDAVDLHRRVWVGRGGSADQTFLRASVAELGFRKPPGSGYGEDTALEIATPLGFGVFKTPGGSRAYFHGGLSLQELIIPVMRLTPKAKHEEALAGDIQWELRPGSAKLTTRFFSVQIRGHVASLLSVSLPKVRVEIREGKECVSNPVAASYGFEDSTGAVEMKMSQGGTISVEPNSVTLNIIKVPSRKTVSVHLLDAGSGRELARLNDVEVAISI